MQQRNRRQTPAGASPACGSVSEPFKDLPVMPSRGENTPRGERMSLKHSVFVLSENAKPLTPTTRARARKLLRAGVAVKRWSKFGTFGIQLLTETRTYTPETALGVDNGTKFEGYSVVVGNENPLNVKLDLPDKKVIVRKLGERRALRRARRHRNCWRRPKRFDNRRRGNWLAPSQAVLVGSRLKVIRECFRIYPIQRVGFEDVRFYHARKRWGANFSTVEIGKTKLKKFFTDHGAKVFEYRGHETQELRKKYGYRKTQIKSADKFTAHCTDSLALAVDVFEGRPVLPGPFLVVDDTYRPKRRRLYDTQPAKGGIREPYSRGTIFGLRKGLLVGARNNQVGQLCGEYKGGYRYYDAAGKRGSTKQVNWISSNFKTRRSGDSPIA
jgi:ribosomal protein L21